jgi:hypothetical protein
MLMAHDVLDHLAEVFPGDGLQIYSVLDHVRELGRAPSRVVVISTRGAPFLTVSDERAIASRSQRSSRAYGHLTWIDCRSDTLRQYFHVTWPEPPAASSSEEGKRAAVAAP